MASVILEAARRSAAAWEIAVCEIDELMAGAVYRSGKWELSTEHAAAKAQAAFDRAVMERASAERLTCMTVAQAKKEMER